MAVLSACAVPSSVPPLPPGLADTVEVLDVADPAYAQANVAAAVKPAGQGGVSQAVVIRLRQDMAVYRLWNGPGAVAGNNRLGSWWAFDPPRGTQEGYRRAYEICGTWNQLAWVAQCTLKQGAVVAIGPGQSVSAATCADASGFETYGSNGRNWQVYVFQAWQRPDTLACPPEAVDYPVDPADVSRASPAVAPKE